ncbi:hypothetical protein C8J57DRAFT_1376013, partial [Mycena rebaudengoi]
LGLLRPTFPAMRLATCLSSLQCTPLQPSSHLFHYETTLPLSTVRRTNTADRTPGGACHCPVMAHAQLYFSNGARVIAPMRLVIVYLAIFQLYLNFMYLAL